jgi:murein L,D-transpeptidase YcbB/YkuD
MIVIVRKVNGVVGPSTRDWLRLTSDNRRIVDVNLRASG